MSNAITSHLPCDDFPFFFFDFRMNTPAFEDQLGCVSCSAQETADGRFECYALCDFEVGEEVTFDYAAGETGLFSDFATYHGFFNDLYEDSSEACISQRICATDRIQDGDWKTCSLWDDEEWFLTGADGVGSYFAKRE